MHPNSNCLDCVEAKGLCETCSFVAVRYKWRLYHGTGAPPRLWYAANLYGGRYVYTTLKRKGFRVDAKVYAPKAGSARWQ